jgi:hypothetical protein
MKKLITTLACLAMLRGCVTLGIETQYGSAAYDGKTLRLMARPVEFELPRKNGFAK